MRGGGQAYDDERRVKEYDDGSDVEDDGRPGRDLRAEGAPPLVPPAVPAAAAAPVPPPTVGDVCVAVLFLMSERKRVVVDDRAVLACVSGGHVVHIHTHTHTCVYICNRCSCGACIHTRQPSPCRP